MNAKELDHLCRAWKTEPECCPFCACDEQDILYFLSPSGAEGARRNIETGDYVHFYVTCCQCHASGPERDTPMAAVEEWNKVSRAVWEK